MNISIAEAKAKFSELVKRAEAGEEIIVTRHGKMVARFMPPNAKPEERSASMAHWRARSGLLTISMSSGPNGTST